MNTTTSAPAVLSSPNASSLADAEKQALADKRNAVIDRLMDERINARKNKKGALVIAAFDVLEDLLINRDSGDEGAANNARLDAFVTAFKV